MKQSKVKVIGKKKDYHIYTILSCMYVISFTSTVFVPDIGMAKDIASMPGILALFLALFKILKDEIEYAKQLNIEREISYDKLSRIFDVDYIDI